jgi:hypothetical protein
MFTLPYVVYFFAYKLSGLRGGRLTLLRILPSAFQCFFFGHDEPPVPVYLPG